MKTILKQAMVDTWIFLKIKLRLPLPLRNHFYKRHRITVKKNWFCCNCHSIFDLLPWGNNKGKLATDLAFSHCHSTNIFWSTEVFKAVIDEKPKDYLYSLTTKTYPYEF